MPDTTEDLVPGMSGASTDPVTGERREWSTPPTRRVAPPDPYGMESMDRAAVAQAFQNHKADEALKFIEASIQMQGQRGYQKALQDGVPTEKAIAKYGPMMFYHAPQAFAPSVKALTPPPAAAWTPGTNGAPSAFTMPGHMPVIPKPTGQKPSDVLAREKFEWMKAHPKANPEDYETIHTPGTKPIEGLPAVPGEVKSFLGIDALAKDKPAQAAIPGVPGTPSKTRKVLISPPAGLVSESATTTPVAKAAPIAPAPTNRTERVEGKPYKLPNGKIGTWTKEGWKVE